jgi:hypothetical protein
MDFSKMSTAELQQLIANSEHKEPEQKEPEHSLLDTVGQAAGKFNRFIEGTRLPAFAGGLLQGAGDIGASLGNLVMRPLGHPIPHPNLSQYIDKSPLSRIAFGAGELGSNIPLYASGAGLIGRAGMTAEAGLSGKLAEGLASGFLMGENKEGERGEGALMGAAIPTGSAALKGLAKLKSSKIAENVLKGFKKAEGEASNQFGNVFSEADTKGITHISRVPVNVNLLKKQGDRKFLHAFEEFHKNPTITNAHSAQSDLAKYANNIGRPQNTLERQAKEEALKASQDIREKMMQEFHATGNTGLALKYNNARKFYKNIVSPYLNSKSIKKLQSGELRPKNFANKIEQEEAFMSKIGQHEHPEIDYRRKLKKAIGNKAVQYGAGTALSGIGLYEIAKMLK